MTKTPKNTALVRAIEVFGSQNKLAKALNVSSAALYYWKWVSGITPAEYCIAIEALTAGKVKRSDLRPDIYPA